MDLEQALVRHTEWKNRFREAIFRQESMDADSIARDDCCELGKWLHGPGLSRFGNLSVFQTCLSRHAMFHLEAARIARMINQKQFQQAEAALEDSAYTVASSAVVVAITQLRQQTKG
ncbi:CZB domain-containing protein [Chromobacterium sphagni]|uniref:Chemotaxis protein n=1 Tax=Chromobacterium sphagni TaxID=1903179 RepID=A0A1S1WUA0_9NEIS|nr:CZB domain-containing protein [Chromobacterium sphagni]OHX10836.1 chemotaxis protein [Chromobacterium sphagni]OHX19523.1 chemotaxis protein [Chromobacterium sphagni]